MKYWEYILLFFLGLTVTLIMASFQAVPGYMDAEYYDAGGIQIASGKGLIEPFLWNYLDDPAGLPHPANTYWMPLAALLAAGGMVIAGNLEYFSARLLFFPLAALVPVLTAFLAFRLTERRSAAWMAGGLGAFSGFYVLYLGLTETFGLYMILGSLFLWIGTTPMPGLRRALGLGGLAGLIHLARAEGILWLAVAGILVGIDYWKQRSKLNWQTGLIRLAGLLLTYAVIMGFWYGRNLVVFGSLFPPGTSRALWLVNYDQLYAYPANSLTFQNWMGSGIGELVQVRWDALISNLQTVLAVQGAVFLSPLILVGFWRLRHQTLVKVGAVFWLATLGVMTLIFPLAGSRGGFLHSGAAFQPLFWAASSEGLMGFVSLGVRWRSWKPTRAVAGFGLIAVVVAAFSTAGVAGARLASGDPQLSGWQASWDAYSAAGLALNRLGAQPGATVMVNDPPGFYLATRHPALAIPNGDLDVLLAASRRYQASYLVLEENTVKDLRSLYRQPVDQPGLKYLEMVGKVYLFQILNP